MKATVLINHGMIADVVKTSLFMPLSDVVDGRTFLGTSGMMHHQERDFPLCHHINQDRSF